MKWINKLLTKIVGTWKECKPSDYITIEGHVRGNPPPKAVCTCGWSFGPHRLNVTTLEAKEHERSTGHVFRDSLYYNETTPKKIYKRSPTATEKSD